MKILVNGDLWLHLGSFLAIAFGAADLWHFHALSHDAELLFLVGGFAGLGLKIANGTASLLQQFAETQTAALTAATAQIGAPPAAAPPPSGGSPAA